MELTSAGLIEVWVAGQSRAARHWVPPTTILQDVLLLLLLADRKNPETKLCGFGAMQASAFPSCSCICKDIQCS